MKFFEKVASCMAKSIASIWKFFTRTFTICLVGSIATFIIALLMPKNMLNVIEVIRNIFG